MNSDWRMFIDPGKDLPQPCDDNESQRKFVFDALIKRGLSNNTPVFKQYHSGACDSLEELHDAIMALGAQELLRTYTYDSKWCSGTFLWPTGFLFIDIHRMGDELPIVHCRVLTDSQDLRTSMMTVLRDLIKDPPRQGNIYALTQQGRDISLTSLGKASMPFEEDNYDPKVIEDLNHVITDLASITPCGRLTIVDGPPGTGKSSLIRMLIGRYDFTFILVPSYQLVDWTSPSLLPLLLAKKKEFNGPPIFILEDADDCLVPRSSGNMNAISSILNLTDGILNCIFDLRVIATTNAKVEEVDEAITRDGRLCKRVMISPLEKEQANRVYKRITGKDKDLFDRPATLAEIYKASKDPNRVETIVKRQSTRLGFAS